MPWFGLFPRRVGSSISPLWLWPAIGAALAFAIGLVVVDVPLDESLNWLAWPGDGESARAMLQVLAGSIITVTGLTFSLTVLALQLASQQFSPRLLRDFTRDRIIRAVLTILIGALVFTTTVLREVDADRALPEVGLLVASVLGLVAVAAVLAFITHIARLLRVDTMMRTVHDETDKAITAFYPAYDDRRPRSPDELSLDPASGVVVSARTSGFVRAVNVAALVRAARAHDLVVFVEIRPGDHVVRGTPVATVWPRGGSRPSAAAAADLVHAGIMMGYERTIEQDAALYSPMMLR